MPLWQRGELVRHDSNGGVGRARHRVVAVAPPRAVGEAHRGVLDELGLGEWQHDLAAQPALLDLYLGRARTARGDV
jgi:hypothetical protein